MAQHPPSSAAIGGRDFRVNMTAAVRFAVLWASVAVALCSGLGEFDASAVGGLTDATRTQIITNVAQFSSLSGADYLSGRNFRLTGVVTLVDTNRDLVVLQYA